MTAVRALVSGVVQGVGFRWSAAREAERLGVTGTVRNLPDGRVEAVVAGAEAGVDAMLAWLRTGPPGARVDAVATTPVDDPGLAGFEIR